MKAQTSKRRQYDLAIAFLLIEPTIAAAAGRAGVSEGTLIRWMKEPEFQVAYRQARREVVERSIGRLQQASGEAVETLQRNLKCGAPPAEIAAARAILDKAIQGLEVSDLRSKVARLEELLAKLKGTNDEAHGKS